MKSSRISSATASRSLGVRKNGERDLGERREGNGESVGRSGRVGAQRLVGELVAEQDGACVEIHHHRGGTKGWDSAVVEKEVSAVEIAVEHSKMVFSGEHRAATIVHLR